MFRQKRLARAAQIRCENTRRAFHLSLQQLRQNEAAFQQAQEDFAIERKADNSPLTIADKRSHAHIMDELDATSIPVLSEEGRLTDYNIRKGWKTLWVVDPLDGTKEFIKRNGEFTVNIALVENGIPVLGVIYVPVSRTLYFSEDSIGAYRIEGIDARSAGLSPDDLMEKADRLPLEQADTKGFVVVASRSHLSPETEEYIRKLESEYGHVNLISCGSSLKICRVAEGSADIYPRFAPTMEWDTAAGHAIVRASGKNIYLTDERTPLHYNKENLLNPWFIVK